MILTTNLKNDRFKNKRRGNNFRVVYVIARNRQINVRPK